MNQDKFDIIIEMITKLTLQVNNIENKLNLLSEKNQEIKTSCSKMNEHVDFVENTYSTVRAPLNFIKNKIECMMGKFQSDELPAIKDKDNNMYTLGDDYDKMNSNPLTISSNRNKWTAVADTKEHAEKFYKNAYANQSMDYWQEPKQILTQVSSDIDETVIKKNDTHDNQILSTK
jgi:hypothetical protein